MDLEGYNRLSAIPRIVVETAPPADDSEIRFVTVRCLMIDGFESEYDPSIALNLIHDERSRLLKQAGDTAMGGQQRPELVFSGVAGPNGNKVVLEDLAVR